MLVVSPEDLERTQKTNFQFYYMLEVSMNLLKNCPIKMGFSTTIHLGLLELLHSQLKILITLFHIPVQTPVLPLHQVQQYLWIVCGPVDYPP